MKQRKIKISVAVLALIVAIGLSTTVFARHRVNGVCGPANGTTVSTAPTSNLCSVGTASSVSGTGPWTWSCFGDGGGTTAQCKAFLASAGGDPAFYVSTGGNDSNPGTLDLPFKTIAKAQLTMQGSTTKTTYIRAGTYN